MVVIFETLCLAQRYAVAAYSGVRATVITLRLVMVLSSGYDGLWNANTGAWEVGDRLAIFALQKCNCC